MQKHFYMVKDVLSFEKFVLLGREIISLQTISNVFEITQQQNSIKSSRVHIHTGLFKMIVRVLTTCHTQYT